MMKIIVDTMVLIIWPMHRIMDLRVARMVRRKRRTHKANIALILSVDFFLVMISKSKARRKSADFIQIGLWPFRKAVDILE